LLETYFDLELQAELLGSEADLAYRQRLHQAIGQVDLLPELHAALRSREGELQQARHEAARTRLELNQIQEELKQLVLDDGQRQQLLDTRNNELQSLQENIQALQQELQPKVDNLEQQLLTREKQLQDSRDDAQSTLQQLHQLQEEQRLLILADHQKQQLLDTSTQELQSLQGNIQALQQELQPRMDSMEIQHRTLEKLLKETREDAELTLLQLQQAQEELEKLFLADQQKRQLVEARDHELHNLRAEHQALEQELQQKVTNLEQQVRTRDKQLQSTCENAEITLFQLNEIQEELEQLFLVDHQKQQLLDNSTQELQNLQGELEALQQELQLKDANLEKQLQIRDRELREARDDSELTLLQLHQVQEELERYFMQTRAQSQLVEAQTDQLNRTKRVLAKFAMSDLSPGVDVAAVAVEVLPAADPSGQHPSLQVQALLDTYASSLERANELIAKAMRR
jgi:chromosome segregation ATPase